MKTLEETINEDFTTAYKNKNLELKNFLSVIKGEIETAKKLKSYREDTPLTIVKKMKQSLELGVSVGDEKSARELGYLKKYLPSLMEDEEIRNKVETLIQDGNSQVPSIMKNFNTLYRGQADNTRVKAIAEELLKI